MPLCCFVEPGQPLRRNKLIEGLVGLPYDRDDEGFARGTFRVRGDTVEVHPSYTKQAPRIAFRGDKVDTLELFDPLPGETLEWIEHKYPIHPKSHHVTPKAIVQPAVGNIRQEPDGGGESRSASPEEDHGSPAVAPTDDVRLWK
jgi:excinuclease ABC subunit B